MDFGVAKAVSEATGRDKITTAGVALGTLGVGIGKVALTKPKAAPSVRQQFLNSAPRP